MTGLASDAAMGEPLLCAEHIVAGYTRGIDILRDVSVAAWRGRVSCVVGPNGTGKSTLLKALFGFLRPAAGSVRLARSEITGEAPYAMLRRGVAYLPQRPSLFPHLSVETNLKLGLWHRRPRRAALRAALDAVFAQFPVARDKRRQAAGQLSGGQQRQIEIARSLMADPAVYLIDEPTAGVDPKTSETIYDLIDELARRRGKAILLVDQDIKSALAISDYVYVVKTGTIVSQGPRDHFGGDVDELVARWLHVSGDRDHAAPA
jgi:branched-chain amino acid transport system ATP-binding protein